MRRSAVVLLFLAVILVPAVKLAAKESETQFKVAEVEPITIADGVKLPDSINPQHFLSLLLDGVREKLRENGVAAETVAEGRTVPDALAASSIVVECSITHTKLGFKSMSNPPKLTMEIKIYRRSDRALMASASPTLKMMGGWYSDDEHFAAVIGEWVSEEIQTALKKAARR